MVVWRANGSAMAASAKREQATQNTILRIQISRGGLGLYHNDRQRQRRTHTDACHFCTGTMIFFYVLVFVPVL